jgi:hypothetical protein
LCKVTLVCFEVVLLIVLIMKERFVWISGEVIENSRNQGKFSYSHGVSLSFGSLRQTPMSLGPDWFENLNTVKSVRRPEQKMTLGSRG